MQATKATAGQYVGLGDVAMAEGDYTLAAMAYEVAAARYRACGAHHTADSIDLDARDARAASEDRETEELAARMAEHGRAVDLIG